MHEDAWLPCLLGCPDATDSLVCYAVNPENGKLSLVGHTPTGGKTARSFGIDRTGKWMLIGNQNSDTIVQFKINTRTGELMDAWKWTHIWIDACIDEQGG